MAKDIKKTQKKNVKEEKIEKVNKKENVKQQKNDVVNVVKKENKKEKAKFTDVVKKVDDNRKTILFFVVGFLLATLLFRCILWPDRIATLSDGTQPVVTIDGKPYTANQLYEEMKEYFSISRLMDEIDNIILTKKYPEDDDMKTQVTEKAQTYYSYYESYGSTKEQFLSDYGFASEEQFMDAVRLEHRRDLYFKDYLNDLITDDEIQKYYDKEVFGDVDSKHILVKVNKDSSSNDGLSDADAKKLAKEIIKKLDSGTSWEDVITEYKDQIITEDLGYMAFNASLESAYLKECKNLKVGTYSKTPVLTSYGYHIVYKKAQKDTPKLKEVKDDIIEILSEEKKSKDKDLLYKALIFMREDAKLEFEDTVFEDAYKKYISQYK